MSFATPWTVDVYKAAAGRIIFRVVSVTGAQVYPAEEISDLKILAEKREHWEAVCAAVNSANPYQAELDRLKSAHAGLVEDEKKIRAHFQRQIATYQKALEMEKVKALKEQLEKEGQRSLFDLEAL